MANEKKIRFVAICDMDGDLKASGQNDAIQRLLPLDETKRTLQFAVKAWANVRRPHFDKIGMGLYTLTVYEKLKRVTMPLDGGNLLFFTMDNAGEENQIIDGVLTLMKKVNA